MEVFLDSEVVVQMMVGDLCTNSQYCHIVRKCKSLINKKGGRLQWDTIIGKLTGRRIV